MSCCQPTLITCKTGRYQVPPLKITTKFVNNEVYLFCAFGTQKAADLSTTSFGRKQFGRQTMWSTGILIERQLADALFDRHDCGLWSCHLVDKCNSILSTECPVGQRVFGETTRHLLELMQNFLEENPGKLRITRKKKFWQDTNRFQNRVGANL